MASIHGSIFVIVGIIIGGISFFKPELLIFRYASLLFIVYGVIKLLVVHMNSDKSESKKLRTDGMKHPHQNAHGLNQQNVQERLHEKQQMIYCKKCSSQMTVYDNFCSYCGFRLRQ